MKAGMILALSCLTLWATPRPDALEKMAQPKAVYEVSRLDSAAFEGTRGELSTLRQKFRIDGLFGGFAYTRTDLRWRHETQLPFGGGDADPIETLHRLELSARIPYPISERWFALGILRLDSTFEERIDRGIGGGVMAFASYRIDDDHTLQLGAFANIHDVETLAMPVVGYSYRFRASDGFQMLLGFPRTYLGYRINDRLLVNAGMIFSQTLSALSNDSTLLGAGYAELKSYLLNVGVRYDASEHFEIVADLLYGLRRELTLYDSHGRETGSYRIDPSLGTLIKLRYRF